MPIINPAGIRPIERQQPTEGMERVRRRDEGSGFRPQTNVNLKAAIQDIAATLGKIVAEERTGLQKLPKEVGDVVKNILQQALSVDSTLGKGVGSTIESQRFSMEQLTLFARMLSQMGVLADRGYSMRLSEETQTLLTQFKAALVAQEGGEALEPVLMSKAAFELVDAKTAEQLPQVLYEILSHLAQVSMGTQQQQSQPQSESMQFLKQLVKYFMPRPGVDVPTEKQSKHQASNQPGQQRPPTSSSFLNSLFRTGGGQNQGQPTFNQQGQPTFNQQGQPTLNQQGQPTFNQQGQPTLNQQGQPTFNQQGQPTFNQQGQPTLNQQGQPTLNQQGQPTLNQQGQPTFNQQGQPTFNQQGQPTFNQQGQPTFNQQGQPTFNQQGQPTLNQQGQPTFNQQGQPTLNQQGQPTLNQQGQPTFNQQGQPTLNQQGQPTAQFTQQGQPTTQFNQQGQPTAQFNQQGQPTLNQQGQPTFNQQGQPTFNQQGQPTFNQQGQPTFNQQGQPTFNQQGQPTAQFNQQGQPTFNQQGQPTFNQQGQPTLNQQGQPTAQFTQQGQPTFNQQGQPTLNQQGQPTLNQQGQPTFNQQGQPTFNQQGQPTLNQQGQPTAQFTQQGQPTAQFTQQGQPTFTQQGQPTTQFNQQGQPTFTQQGQPTFTQQGQPTTQFNQQGQPTFTQQGQPTTQTTQQQATQFAQSGQPIPNQEEPLSKDFIERQKELRFYMKVAKDSMIKQTLQNTPQTNDAMKSLAQFLMRGSQMTPRDAALLQNFVNNSQHTMSETEARHLQNLLRLCQQNIPLTVQQAAVQQKLPDLPRLWAFMQMCDMANIAAKMNPKNYKRAGKDVADFANAMRRAMTAENSVVQNKRSFQMMLPLYMGDDKTSYPTYLSIYDEAERDEETGEDKKETWLRICVLTDYIGAAELVFRVYEETKLDMRFYFSRQDVAEEFRSIYLDDLRNSINQTQLNVGEVRVGGGSERMFSF